MEEGVIAIDGTRDIIDSSDPLAVILEEAEREGVTDPETVKEGLGEAVTDPETVEVGLGEAVTDRVSVEL